MNRRFNIACCLVLLLLSASPAIARVTWKRPVEPWSQFRSKTIRPEKTPPRIQDGKIYLVSSRGEYAVFGADSGKRLVKTKLKARASSGLLVEEGRVYFGSDTGELICLDADSGDLAWVYPLKVIDISPPVISGNLVVFQTGLDAITALNKLTGEWVWTYQHHRIEDISILGISTPVVDKDFIYVGTADGYLLALHQQDGGLAWKKQVFTRGNFKDVDADLAQDANAIFACDFFGEIVAVSKRSGDKFWSYSAGGLGQPLLDGETIFVASQNGRVTALNKDSGAKLWETSLENAKKINPMRRLLSPTLYKQWLIVPNLRGKIFFLDPATGKLDQTKNLRRPISVPIQVAGDSLYLFSNKGILYKLNY